MRQFQDPFHSEAWRLHLENQQDTVDSGWQEEEEEEEELEVEEDEGSEIQEKDSANVTGAPLNFENGLLFNQMIEQTKDKVLADLTNLDLWIKHFDKSFSPGRVKQALEDGWDDVEVSRSIIAKFLENMNSHLVEIYPGSVLSRQEASRKNFFPKLADILMKRLSIIFDDYINKEDIENSNSETGSSTGQMTAEGLDKHESQQLNTINKKENKMVEYQKIIEGAVHCNHDISVKLDQQNSPIILCDGYSFAEKPGSSNARRAADFKCTKRGCKAFLTIKDGRIVTFPRKNQHKNHPISKALK